VSYGASPIFEFCYLQTISNYEIYNIFSRHACPLCLLCASLYVLLVFVDYFLKDSILYILLMCNSVH
jgi:hypothetical protein